MIKKNKHIAVLAGPGSGKTRVLVHKLVKTKASISKALYLLQRGFTCIFVADTMFRDIIFEGRAK